MPHIRPRDIPDFLTGAIFVAFGLFAISYAQDYTLGTARQMGPGYFPTVLGILLAVFGFVLVVRSFFGRAVPLETFSWWPLAAVTGSIVAFGLTVREAGLVPALMLLTIVSFKASDRFKISTALWLAIGFSLFSWTVFRVGLGLPLPAFGTWFGGQG